jgi:hypothetical protein
MLALEIHINGQKKLTAGMADGGVVTALLGCTFRPDSERNLPREETLLHVSGLDSKHHEHAEWLKSGLTVGDEVLLKVVDAAAADPPTESTRRPQSEQAAKEHVLHMAEQFGWKVDTSP